VSAASACVRGVALQSVKNMRLLRCWANEASTRGCATVCDPAALFGTRPRHCSRRLPAAAVRERHQQHPKRPLVTCGPWVSRLVAHVRLEFRAGAFTSLQLLRCSVPSTRAQLLGCLSVGEKNTDGGQSSRDRLNDTCTVSRPNFGANTSGTSITR
jgi:hypothetical protein